MALTERPVAEGFHASGSSARYTVNVSVQPPSCPGETSAWAAYQCARARLAAVPWVVGSLTDVQTRPGHVQLTFLQDVGGSAAGRGLVVLHTVVFFERAGMWGRLHVSVVRPERQEVRALFELGDGFTLR